jgi:hypothetical protein
LFPTNQRTGISTGQMASPAPRGTWWTGGQCTSWWWKGHDSASICSDTLVLPLSSSQHALQWV